ncbi:hypothetical protein KIS4809_1835 [Bacillus sp. ZZV12-4809]|nr:hypothetical protein KIS4809_1835 [Bacillus sp. ZZV12-4809]
MGGAACDLEGVGAAARQLKRKRLAHPRPAQDDPPGKAFFAFLGGAACDLEGAAAEARFVRNK